MEQFFEFLIEHMGTLFLGLEILILNVFGLKKKTPEEKQAAKLAKKEKQAAKQLAKVQNTMREVEDLKKEV